MARKAKAIEYPGKLIKNLNQRLYRLETRGLTEESPFYMQAEDLALKERYYNWSLKKNGPTVRAITKTQWMKLTPAQQQAFLKMYQGGMSAKTSTASGIKQMQKKWTETYIRHNIRLFETPTEDMSIKDIEELQRKNMEKAEKHKEFFQNFWANTKDHFAYDPETWSEMMQNFDIDAMIDAGISPSRLRDIFNMVKNPDSKHKIPKKYWGKNNKWKSYKDYYGKK